MPRRHVLTICCSPSFHARHSTPVGCTCVPDSAALSAVRLSAGYRFSPRITGFARFRSNVLSLNTGAYHFCICALTFSRLTLRHGHCAPLHFTIFSRIDFSISFRRAVGCSASRCWFLSLLNRLVRSAAEVVCLLEHAVFLIGNRTIFGFHAWA